MNGYLGWVKVVVPCFLFGAWPSPAEVHAATHPVAEAEDVSMPGPASRRRSEIDRLLARLGGMRAWTNGAFRTYELPERATTQALVAEAFPGVETRILEERRTVVGHDPRPYLFVHVRIPGDERVVAFRYEPTLPGWWNREFR